MAESKPKKTYEQDNRHNATKYIDKMVAEYLGKYVSPDAIDIDHNITGTILIHYNLKDATAKSLQPSKDKSR